MLTDQFRSALEDGDVAALRAIWAQAMPHLPQPATDAEATVVMHHARTGAESLPLAKRAYSHAWLVERGYPSGLPDRLKPTAERLYPRVLKAVGVAVRAAYPEVGKAVQQAMCAAVEELHADGVDLDDRDRVRGLMHERRDHALRGFGLNR